jgi:hypothetical protein
MLRWLVLNKVLGVDAVRSWPYLVAKPFHVGVDVDWISSPLCHPTACGCWSGA